MRKHISRTVDVLFVLLVGVGVASCAHGAKRAPGISVESPVKTLFVELNVRLGTGFALTQLASNTGVPELLTALGEELTPELQDALRQQGFETFFDDAAGTRLRELAEGAKAPPVLVTTWRHPQTATVSDLRGVSGRTFLVDETEIARVGGEATSAAAFAVVTLDFASVAMWEVVQEEFAQIRLSIFDRDGNAVFEASVAGDSEFSLGLPTRDPEVLARRAKNVIAQLATTTASGF